MLAAGARCDAWACSWVFSSAECSGEHSWCVTGTAGQACRRWAVRGSEAQAELAVEGDGALHEPAGAAAAAMPPPPRCPSCIACRPLIALLACFLRYHDRPGAIYPAGAGCHALLLRVGALATTRCCQPLQRLPLLPQVRQGCRRAARALHQSQQSHPSARVGLVADRRRPSTPLRSHSPFAAPTLPLRPDHTDHARLARWLVHQLDWGVVSTTSRHLGGVAFGNPLSVADGPCGSPTGRLLFNLSPMDATMQARGGTGGWLGDCRGKLVPVHARRDQHGSERRPANRARPPPALCLHCPPSAPPQQDLAARASASLALHEMQLPGACERLDPEDPRCAKLLVSGSLLPVPPEAQAEARRLLFARHPAMRGWPAGHDFTL